MSVFAPQVDNMRGCVPIACPKCGLKTTRGDLSDEEKQFLIDATGYHEVLTEYHQLQALDSLIRRYPGTRNPLITSKLRERRYGDDDEVDVQRTIDTTPGFREFLESSDFEHFGRYAFVSGLVRKRQEDVMTVLVACEKCRSQYLVLPFDYYMSIG